MSGRRLVIAAGGTGGHMFPAQALAQEMLRRGWRVALSTDARGMRYADSFPPQVERRIVRAATPARGGVAGKVLAPFRILIGVAETWRWFGVERPHCVAGFGGYPSLPALCAALLRGAPRLLHEQNGVLGRVNRLFATRVAVVACGAWPVANAPEGARLEHVGNPIRDAAAQAMQTPYDAPGDGRLSLLIFGGSQGASLLSRLGPAAAALLPDEIRARLDVAQQARDGEVAAVRAAYQEAGVAAEAAPFFEDLPARIGRAHLVISRAGASTVAELAAIGRPSVLIPFAAAMDDHQTANARALAEAGAAVVEPEDGLTAEALSVHIRAILTEPGRAQRMADAARQLGRPDAATRLADLVERIAAPET